MEIAHGRRVAVITERAGKFTLEFFLTFPDDPGYRESMGGAIAPTMDAAIRRAKSWVNS